MYKPLAILFITNAVSMVLELVAARILSPIFGSSTTAMTIVVSAMLLANAVGNYYGGQLSDKFDAYKLSTIVLAISAISIIGIAFLYKYAADALPISVLLLIAYAPIGALSPLSNKLLIKGQNNVGSKSGIIFLVITIGSLFGTLVGGLIMIPLLGCRTILFIMGIITTLTVLISVPVYNKKNGLAYGLISLVMVIACIFGLRGENTNTFDTTENHVEIYESEHNGEPIRIMNVGGGFSSANFTDPNKRDELVYEYTRGYNRVFDANPQFSSFLMIGGAGYSYPRYLISHYPETSIDVVEIDGTVTQIAKESFYLQEFLDEYGEERIGLYTNDGRLFLNDTACKYDVVLNDSFMGNIPARSMATKEAVRAIKDVLNPGGIYAVNVIGATDGYREEFLKSEVKTISSEFAYVWCQRAGDSYNWVVMASDTDYGYKTEEVDLSKARLLTDDYAPVETMNWL